MQRNINKILQDIYQIDDSLRQHEKKLIKIIKQILESRPDTKFDEKFAQKLRAEVMAKARHEMARQAAQLKEQPQSSLINLINRFKLMRKEYYMVGAVVIVMLLIIPTVYYVNKSNKIADLGKTKLAFEPSINKLKDQAFGSLTTQSQTNLKILEGGGGGPLRQASEASGIGSAMPAPAGVAQDEAVGLGGGGGVYSETAQTRAIGVPAPEIINYEFVYNGDDFTIEQEKMSVYRRTTDARISQQLLENINKTNFGIVDLSKFSLSSADVTNFNLVEDKDFGYSIYFNLMDSMISINKNWQKWPRPEMECQELQYPQAQNCYDKYRLKYEDVPEDSKLIALANQFIKDYNINIGSYGEPEVLKYWQEEYLRVEDKSLVYISDTIPVVYPLTIERKNVYYEGGEKSGLTAEVDIRYNKVAGLNNIISQNFAKSDYEMETDNSKIMEITKQGGVYPIYKQANPTKTITVELGTPEVGLMEMWKYNQEKNKSDILYIPSLVFPVVKASEENYYYSKNLVVPLAKEIIEQRQDVPIGIPEPMPLMDVDEAEDKE